MLAGECYGTSMSFKTLCVVRLKFILSYLCFEVKIFLTLLKTTHKYNSLYSVNTICINLLTRE